jgi:hypothetical protein
MQHSSMFAVAAPAFVRRVTALAALAALVLLLVGAAQAGATVQHSVTPFSSAAIDPCSGETGTLSGTETATTLFSVTDNQFLYESTIRTDLTFTPDNPALASASGHGIDHVSFVNNHPDGPFLSGTAVYTETSTNVFHAGGGTVVVHITIHTTVADGRLIVSVGRPVFVCQVP